MSNNRELTQKMAYTLLFLLAILWSSTTIIMKLFIKDMGASHFMFGRFTIAAIIFYAVRHKHIKFDKKSLIHGAITGFFLFFAYYTSIVGLKYTTASKAGFLVSLSVLWVPLFQLLVHKKRPSRWVVTIVILSIIGLYLISGLDGIGFNYGDFLEILCSLSYMLYIMYIDKYIEEMSGDQMTFIILSVVAIWSLFSAAATETINPMQLVDNWLVVLVVAIGGTLLTTYFQTKAQSVASPEAVGVILLSEPLITLIMAIVLIGESVTLSGIMGGALLLSALLIAIVKKI